VIEGTVRDAFGRPAERAQVTLLQRRAGEQRLLVAFSGGMPITSTDDRGRYRFFGVPPGDYTVGVWHRSFPGLDLTQTTADGMRWATEVLRTSGPPASPAPAAQLMGAAPVFFPGVTDPALAGVFPLGTGEERLGVDLTASLVPTATLSGRVVGPDGQPARSLQVNIVPDGMTVQSLSFPLFVRPLNDGTFSVAGVTPGRYVLVARAASGAASLPPGGRGGAPTLDLWGMHTFEVRGADVTGVAVPRAPGLDVRGRVVMETSTPQTTMPPVIVRLPAATTTGASVAATPAMAGPDGSFVVRGVVPSTYRITISAPSPAGSSQIWTMKSAVVGGVDVTDTPMTVERERGVDDLVITITDRVTEVGGRLTDPTGRPAPEYSILVFPVDQQQWAQGSRRRPAAVRPATDGRYRIAGFPPGEYFIVALTSIESSEFYDSSFLTSLIPTAQRFTVAEGEKKVLDFKIAGGPPEA